MAGSTKYYEMAFFDFGDELDSTLNVQKEIDRFVLIDKQIYGLYNVFGNGVISGWEVSDNGFSPERGISATVSSGSGVINFIASETNFPTTIESLPPNSVVNIYAVLQGETVQDRVVDFTFSTSNITNDFSIRIAQIVTGSSSISSIDNTVRDLIGFKETIQEEIEAHKHRGDPSKIDLENEVKNQLEGARIADLDASKITEGVIPVDQMPILDHNDLDHNGLLTHAQLDTFVQNLSDSNKELLGEVASVNLLKNVIFQKYKDADVDEHFINEMALIPGISPDSFIDFESSTANIDTFSQCISGTTAPSGEFLSIIWDDDLSFKDIHKKTNISISNDVITLKKDETSIEVIENFEVTTGANTAIPGFTKETVVIVDNLKILSEGSDTLRSEGYFSGKFTSNRDFRAKFTKTFDSNRDWSDFDRINFSVKTNSVSHGPVYAYFVSNTSGIETESDVFLLLAEDEITDNADLTKNDFVDKEFDISGQERSAVTKLVIFTDDVDSTFEFFLDDIFVKNTSLFKSQGSAIFRYSSVTDTTFHSIFYSINAPDGTDYTVRVRSAGSDSLLTRSQYTRALRSGEVIVLPGSSAEIEINLYANQDKSLTPTINSVELRLLTDSSTHGIVIDTASEWTSGTLENVKTVANGSLSDIEMGSPINVDGWSFSLTNSIREIDSSKNGVYGFSGKKMPVSPSQAKNWNNQPFKKFSESVSSERRFDKTFLIADRDNDRILHVDSSGNLIKGIGGVNDEDETLYPFTSSYNPDDKILTIITSKVVDKDSIDLTKMSLFFGNTELPLSNTAESVIDNKKSDQIIEISISSDKASSLSGQTDVFLSLSPGVFAEEIEFAESASKLLGIRGIEVFIGDFTYIDEIKSPIAFTQLENGNWVYANSNINYIPGETDATVEDSQIASLVELDLDNLNIEFSSSLVNFSDFSLGGIVEQTASRLVVAGIYKDELSIASETNEETASDDAADDATDDTVASVVNMNDPRAEFRSQGLSKLSGYRGIVAILDKESNKIVFQYTSPDGLYASDVSINSDGNLLVAESSFSGLGGRVILLDNFGNIIRIFGGGSYTIVNDSKALENGNIVVSL